MWVCFRCDFINYLCLLRVLTARVFYYLCSPSVSMVFRFNSRCSEFLDLPPTCTLLPFSLNSPPSKSQGRPNNRTATDSRSRIFRTVSEPSRPQRAICRGHALVDHQLCSGRNPNLRTSRGASCCGQQATTVSFKLSCRLSSWSGVFLTCFETFATNKETPLAIAADHKF